MRSLITICDTEIRVEGGWLRTARLEADGYQFLENPELAIEQIRHCGKRIDLFNFLQKVPESTPKYGYPMEWHNFAALTVSTYDHWFTKQVDAKTRNMVRKAEKKGVEVREVAFDETLVKGIQQVYNESPVRQGEPNSHYGKDFDTVYKMEATFLDSSVFLGAYLGDDLIGFVKLVQNQTRSQAGLMNIVSMVQHRDKAPTNALLAQAVRVCSERKIPFLVYASFAYGKKQHSSLADFKKNNGFERVDVPRYYVALTGAGRLALRAGLHHKLSDRLPESVAAKLRDLRSAWYNRKFRSLTEAV